ncbi:hypothetical protein [Hyphomonas sp.]|uniref:hypothetical protein n=1 Tax=Hyphomonas sp. TaxID=87 RepID=UPI003528CA53
MKTSASLLAGLALAACASTPEDASARPLALCQAMVTGDTQLELRINNRGATMDDLCACYVQIEAGLDEETRADNHALMTKIIEMREGSDLSTEDVAELMEDDRDGSLYGLTEERMKRGAQPVEDAMSKARRDPESCHAS